MILTVIKPNNRFLKNNFKFRSVSRATKSIRLITRPCKNTQCRRDKSIAVLTNQIKYVPVSVYKKTNNQTKNKPINDISIFVKSNLLSYL